ncbi:hypothetical protein EVAR_49055_1 [Eumeta japonica]|uniref:Uncharacterized protein n=1 Tax=Eumeta variegata TaxID=151549 RepID=A0A4C1Y6I8_EUMVA|nr:hypothetical protein EVAR_49055_1 [Eumeta japonica]
MLIFKTTRRIFMKFAQSNLLLDIEDYQTLSLHLEAHSEPSKSDHSGTSAPVPPPTAPFMGKTNCRNNSMLFIAPPRRRISLSHGAGLRL